MWIFMVESSTSLSALANKCPLFFSPWTQLHRNDFHYFLQHFMVYSFCCSFNEIEKNGSLFSLFLPNTVCVCVCCCWFFSRSIDSVTFMRCTKNFQLHPLSLFQSILFSIRSLNYQKVKFKRNSFNSLHQFCEHKFIYLFFLLLTDRNKKCNSLHSAVEIEWVIIFLFSLSLTRTFVTGANAQFDFSSVSCNIRSTKSMWMEILFLQITQRALTNQTRKLFSISTFDKVLFFNFIYKQKQRKNQQNK